MNTIIDNIKNELDSIKALKYVDENWGQLDYYSPNFPVKWPCALVDVSEAQFSNLGMDKSATPVHRQMADYRVEIRVANLKLTNTSVKAPATQKAQAHSVWVLIEDIHKKLQGFTPGENSSKLIRAGLSRVNRDDGVQEYSIIYSSSLHNC
jgi:hypothetical protein